MQFIILGGLMDIEAELKATQQKLKDITKQINELERQKQEMPQELLRLDGEVRGFKRLLGP